MTANCTSGYFHPVSLETALEKAGEIMDFMECGFQWSPWNIPCEGTADAQHASASNHRERQGCSSPGCKLNSLFFFFKRAPFLSDRVTVTPRLAVDPQLLCLADMFQGI